MSGRTLPPTPRRLREARRRGEVPVSRSLVGLGATAGGLVALAILGPSLARDVAARLRSGLLLAVSGREVDGAGLARAAAIDLVRLVAAPALAACAGALVAGLPQTGGLFAPGSVRLRWERLDPGAGLQRLFSPRAAGRAAFTSAVALLALAIGARHLIGKAELLAQLPRMRPGAAWAAAASTVGSALAPLLALLAVAGVVDLAWERFRHARDLRMTRAERDRDVREEEGDPRQRSERRRLHASVSAPRRPTCLVVNPTHVAVALAHRRGDDDPPVVLGKGSGRRAAALRREARRLGVPIVHDPLLARALYRLADVGDSIPEELYEATAAVLAHVHALARGAHP